MLPDTHYCRTRLNHDVERVCDEGNRWIRLAALVKAKSKKDKKTQRGLVFFFSLAHAAQRKTARPWYAKEKQNQVWEGNVPYKIMSGNRPRFTRNPALENAALEFFSPDFIKAHTQKELYQLIQEERRKRDQKQPQPPPAQGRTSSTHHRGQDNAHMRGTPPASPPERKPSFDTENRTRPTIHVPPAVTASASAPPTAASEPSGALVASPPRSAANGNGHGHSHNHSSSNSNRHAGSLARDDLPGGSGSSTNHRPPATAPPAGAADDMLTVIGDIEAQFASWHAGVKRCIKQVRLLESPQEHEVLNKCFSGEERTRIMHSIKSNAKEVYWNLYRLLSDIYQQRNEQLQEWGQDALLTRDDQEYCQDRQQALFDLVTRYKQLLN